jgi:hypothetical protein
VVTAVVSRCAPVMSELGWWMVHTTVRPRRASDSRLTATLSAISLSRPELRGREVGVAKTGWARGGPAAAQARAAHRPGVHTRVRRCLAGEAHDDRNRLRVPGLVQEDDPGVLDQLHAHRHAPPLAAADALRPRSRKERGQQLSTGPAGAGRQGEQGQPGARRSLGGLALRPMDSSPMSVSAQLVRSCGPGSTWKLGRTPHACARACPGHMRGMHPRAGPPGAMRGSRLHWPASQASPSTSSRTRSTRVVTKPPPIPSPPPPPAHQLFEGGLHHRPLVLGAHGARQLEQRGGEQRLAHLRGARGGVAS